MGTSGHDLPPAQPGTKSRSLSVQRRITLLLAITTAGFIGLMLLVQDGWRRQVNLLLHERVRENQSVLLRILDLRASGPRVHADDYTRWDDFVAFAHQVDPRWGELNITQSIATFGLDVAWVLDARFDLVFTANPQEKPALAPLPVPAATLVPALREHPISHFFARTPKGLIEIWTSPIQPSEDFARRTPINGYYIIGRLWNAARMKELAGDAGARAVVLPARDQPAGASVSSETGLITIAVPLPAIDGSPLAMAVFQSHNPLVARVRETLRVSLLLLVAGVLCMVIAVGWALAHWVGQPVARISEALRRQDPGLLRWSSSRSDEIAGLARLVEDFFDQRKKLIEAREAADKAAQAKSVFLANMSHELRTPLHGILSYSRFGLREALTADREELLEDFRNIEDSGSGLLTLLNDLLDLAKLEAGRMKFEFGEVSLEALVADGVDEFASLFDDGALKVEVIAEGQLDPIVADRRKVLQVLRNLLSNAAKFSKPGGTVTIRIETSGGLARVVVEDQGLGVPEDELELIFDKFAQASNSHSKTGGTGLGLAICREIVDGHEGRIWAENRAEGGARMTFELPVAGPSTAGESGEAEALLDRDAPAAGVVDDQAPPPIEPGEERAA
jgi:signal transduction histidine kinase